MSIFIPIISSALPIYDVVSSKLNDSLNTDKQNLGGLQVNIQKSEQKFNVKLFMVSLFSVFMGASIYLVFPYGMLTMKVVMFISVFSALLVGFMSGVL